MKVLVTGGAGYIGSVCVDTLISKEHEVTVIDDLSTGFADNVHSNAELIVSSLANRDKVFDITKKFRPDAVVHFAGLVRVDESMSYPEKYFDVNVVYGKNILDACLEYKVRKFVFSSTAATYGMPKENPISETHSQYPINPYGESKLLFEKIVRWYQELHGLKAVIFRYFNASGATKNRGQKQKVMSHLIPNVLKVAAGDKEKCFIFGNDFETPDGTGVRDYIHVADLASAHVKAVEKEVEGVLNLGVGCGYSVMEVIKMSEKVTQKTIPFKICERRLGDPSIIVADSSLAQEKLRWSPVHSSLENIVRSAWNWHR